MSVGQGSAPLSGDALADVADERLAAQDLHTALALYARAEPEVADPDRCAGGRWMSYMLLGDFEAAWRESDAIRRRGRPDPHRFWQGEPIAGRRVILRSLHGLGDAIQLCRFLPRLQSQVADLIVEVPPALVSLAPCFRGMGQVITWGVDAPARQPAWDVQMEVMELPYLLRITADDLRPEERYLQLPVSECQRVQAVMGEWSKPRVALVWSAGQWNPSRSVPFSIMRQLLHVEGIEFWSAQGEPGRGAWLAQGGDARCRDVYSCGGDLLASATALAQMNLLITVDTMAAHLAGALGVPCWLLLQERADWRWMIGRDTSPWYPSLRLWRQRDGEEWGELVGRVQAALPAWVSGQARQLR